LEQAISAAHWVKSGPLLDTVSKAVNFGEVVVLALPGSAVVDFISAHADALAWKIIINTTNNPRSAEMNSLALLAGHK
jgi:predicted dinucleotide-binding enzyme